MISAKMNYGQWERSAVVAASTARNISRLMRKGGFEMAKKYDKWSSTRGFSVHRVGCGNQVSVIFRNGQGYELNRREYKAMVQTAIDFFASKDSR